MSNIDWQNLRSYNGSQNSAFEELCCQLAAYENENLPKNSRFIRKGTPDAGVECYWQLPNGNELGWQAKFFLSTPGPPQWREIDDSVKAALEKHRGRCFFWFKKDLFSHQWFKNRIDEAIANAGPRYSPEINVTLPIVKMFDGLGRTQDFLNRIYPFYSKIKKAHSNTN